MVPKFDINMSQAAHLTPSAYQEVFSLVVWNCLHLPIHWDISTPHQTDTL